MSKFLLALILISIPFSISILYLFYFYSISIAIFPSNSANNVEVIYQSDISVDKYILFVVKSIFFNFMKFALFEVLSLNLLPSHVAVFWILAECAV